MKDCDIVLTGAGGFLGSYLLPVLVADGHRVLAVTSQSLDEMRAKLQGKCDLSKVSVIEQDNLERVRDRFSGSLILSCAFPRGGNGVQMSRGLDFINQLFALAVSEGASGVVNVSSQSVYSASRKASAQESDTLFLGDSYAVAKRSVELLVCAHCEGRVPFTSVRLSSLVGPGFNQRVVNKMAYRALDVGIIEVTTPRRVFDFMDVRDAVSAFAALARSNPLDWSEVYNLGSGNAVTLEELAHLVAVAVRAQGYSCEVRISGDDDTILSSALDASSFCSDFEWVPRYTLAETVEAIVAAVCRGETLEKCR